LTERTIEGEHIEQTEHEWCRLVNLVSEKYGDREKEKLIDELVEDKDTYSKVCNDNMIATDFKGSTNTDNSLIDDS